MPAKGRRAHHDERVLLFVGTRKGVFVYESDFDREKWKRTGPHLAEHAVNSIVFDHRDGKSVYLGTSGGLHRTRDHGRTWERIGRGLPAERVTHVTLGHLAEPGVLWAGLEPAAIARSRDGGLTFEEVEPFRRIDGASAWRAPGGGAGAPLVTSIIVHSDSPKNLHVSASVAGVFGTTDGGQTWVSCGPGVAREGSPAPPDAARDVHRIVSNPAKPDRLWAISGSGIYRTDDDGQRWADVSAGLSSPVTRSIVVSPAKSGTLFVVPLKDTREEPPKVGGPLQVFRSTDGGDSWERVGEGLPGRVNGTVHREALRIDDLDEEGVYLATSDGLLFVSMDEGENWTSIATGLAPVLSLEVVVEGR